MRLRPLLVPGLALVLGGVAILADRALVGQVRAERTAGLLRIDDDAAHAAQAVRSLVTQTEQAVLANRTPGDVEVQRLVAPPALLVPAPGNPSYAGRPRAELAELLGSVRASPNGLPEAVVARLALGPAAPLAGPEGPLPVEERLLRGMLPVRPDDLRLLAERLGVGHDPRLTVLEARLRRSPDPDALPPAPEFRRTMISSARLEGWTRTNDDILVRYAAPVAAWVERAAATEPALVSLAARGAAAVNGSGGVDASSRTVEVPDLPGVVLHVTPRPPGVRVTALRVVLWLAAAAGFAGLVGFRRALDREARAIERERTFLSAITHELRTPLTAIRVLGETLADHRGDPGEYGALVAQETHRLEALVERALTLTRLEQAPRFAPVDPAELLRSALALVGPKAARRSVSLGELAAEALPSCRWDADSVRRAVLNLLDNAVVHGREGGRVEVSARLDGEEIRMSVADDGPGIGRTDRRRVFGRFERGRTGGPGTGLGLYLVETVARAHGGRVDLDSAEGRGARFTLILPIHPPGSPMPEDLAS